MDSYQAVVGLNTWYSSVLSTNPSFKSAGAQHWPKEDILKRFTWDIGQPARYVMSHMYDDESAGADTGQLCPSGATGGGARDWKFDVVM